MIFNYIHSDILFRATQAKSEAVRVTRLCGPEKKLTGFRLLFRIHSRVRRKAELISYLHNPRENSLLYRYKIYISCYFYEQHLVFYSFRVY